MFRKIRQRKASTKSSFWQFPRRNKFLPVSQTNASPAAGSLTVFRTPLT
ncbi:hypothetical protein QH73_0005315 [Scytonema millei VB511283]|uniref:Uncharacterized protein n=1 Tax=Scytonema millei VB511283 TaxID=1245923 RepID=A0A9X5E2R2_9CYAN|nr:hypothetical protein [Scytonema millei VB511283]